MSPWKKKIRKKQKFEKKKLKKKKTEETQIKEERKIRWRCFIFSMAVICYDVEVLDRHANFKRGLLKRYEDERRERGRRTFS